MSTQQKNDEKKEVIGFKEKAYWLKKAGITIISPDKIKVTPFYTIAHEGQLDKALAANILVLAMDTHHLFVGTGDGRIDLMQDMGKDYLPLTGGTMTGDIRFRTAKGNVVSYISAKDGIFHGKAEAADKAVNDGEDRNIADTYVTKAEFEKVRDRVQSFVLADHIPY